MTELDQVWSKMLTDAGENAERLGRREIADYLRLKASNDAIRSAGLKWLFDTVIEAAGREMRDRPLMAIDREDPHSFRIGNSRMVGALVRIRLGVRCLTFEAGWARTPSDGIMRGGALAIARVSHFGMPDGNAELRLVRAEPLPEWFDDEGRLVDAASLARHVEMLF